MSTYTSSSLTLRALLKTAAGRIGAGAPAARVSGLTPAAKAMYAAASAARGRTLLVVATDADVERTTQDARFFFAALEGLSDAEVERVVLPFPSHEVDPYRGLAPHFDIASARARALHALVAPGRTARLIVASAGALLPRLSPPERLASVSLTVMPGQDISPVDLGDLLSAAGYTRQDPVDESGEFCVRGGVVDFFPAGARQPLRLEFMGDTIESIRTYDPATQRSTAALDQAAIAPLQELITTEDEDERKDRSATAFDYLWSGQRPLVLVSEPDEVHAQGEKLTQQIGASYQEAVAKGVPAAPPAQLIASWEEARRWLEGATLLETLEIGEDSEGGTPSRHVSCQPAMEFNGRVQDWAAEIRRGRERGDTVLFIANTAGRAERTIEVLADYDIFAVPIERAEDANRTGVLVGTGYLSRGFRLPEAGLQLWARDRRLRRGPEGSRAPALRDRHVPLRFPRPEGRRSRRPRRSRHRRVRRSEAHRGRRRAAGVHGAPLCRRRQALRTGRTARSGPALQRGGAARARQARRHDLGKGQDPRQESDARHGGGAAQALRRAQGDAGPRLQPGLSLAAGVRGRVRVGSHAGSEHRDHRHQARHGVADDDGSAAVRRRRLRQDRSGDARRLQGGDGRQAGRGPRPDHGARVPAPQDPEGRFAAFPVRIDMVSRFRSKAEQKATLDDLAAGKVEIIVGTHRLLSKDVQFRDLGLLVVDEEQRFGVAHKEKIKQLRKRVDVLTMTATPIPRTLNMSLAGIRDMSIIETPPKDRLSIQTNVVKFDQAVISRAIRTEMERGGQVYFVHNRVESIYSLGNLITRLVPEARIGIGHGQMGEDAARERDGRFRRAQVRRPAGHDHHRERPRHPERQHDASSTAPTATGCRSSISCAAASADRIAAPTPTC